MSTIESIPVKTCRAVTKIAVAVLAGAMVFPSLCQSRARRGRVDGPAVSVPCRAFFAVSSAVLRANVMPLHSPSHRHPEASLGW